MPHLLAGVEQHVLVRAGFLRLVVGGDNFRMIEAEDLIVITMRQLVQDHRRMLEHLTAREKLASLRDVNLARQARVMAVGHQPVAARMILHRLELRMVVLDPDLDGLQFPQRLGRHEDSDALEMVGQHGERLRAFLAMLAVNQRRLDVDLPSLDLTHHRVEAHGGRSFRLLR